ncbi:MAG: hypothetical protein H6728_00785 [Myxococcales bacterium]|nr:hypothetical protein [Myxococcales bacterium]
MHSLRLLFALLLFWFFPSLAQAQPTSRPTSQKQTTSQPTAAPSSSPTQVTSAIIPPSKEENFGYQEGFFLKAPKGIFSLFFRGVLQTRLTWLRDPRPSQQNDTLGVFIRRARLNFHGTAFTKALRYRIQVSFDRGLSGLKDLYLDYTFVEPWLRVRVGQFKRPFSRQFLTSGRRLELVGRSILHDFFWIDRDIGAMLHGRGRYFDWSIGVFNGTTSDTRFLCEVEIANPQSSGKVTDCEITHRPDFLKPALVARVNLHTAGFRGYREGDIEGGGLRFAAGAGTYIEWDADRDGQAGIQAEIDYSLKAHGFASTGSFKLATRQQSSFLEQKLHSLGVMFQASYIFQKTYQLAARYAFTSTPNTSNTLPQHEFSMAFGILLYGHHLKWQNEFSVLLLDEQGQQSTYYRLRSQIQLAI